MTLKANDYATDALAFFRKCILLTDKLDSNDIVADVLLYFAVGVEKFAKHVLANVNPAFIYTKLDFDTVARLHYTTRVKHLPAGEDRKLCEHVVTMREALARARWFSRPIGSHFNALQKLSRYRDTVLHHCRSDLDFEDARVLIRSTLKPFLTDIARELNVTQAVLLQGAAPKLEFTDDESGLTLDKRVKAKLKYYRKEWKKRQLDPSLKERLFWLSSIYRDETKYNMGRCPACGNVALFRAELEYDDEGEARAVYPIGLACAFCGYETSDWQEMDYLKLQDAFYEKNPRPEGCVQE